MKAQGTFEYMVLLGGIVLVAIVVGSLLLSSVSAPEVPSLAVEVNQPSYERVTSRIVG